MNRTHVLFVVLGLTVGAGYAGVRAQDRPGIITPPQVWIQNRDASDAIPVKLTQSETIQRVDIVAMQSSIRTTSARQQWEYRSIQIPAGSDPMSYLQAEGDAGWEVTGVQLERPNAVVLVLKRPRS